MLLSGCSKYENGIARRNLISKPDKYSGALTKFVLAVTENGEANLFYVVFNILIQINMENESIEIKNKGLKNAEPMEFLLLMFA